MNNNNDNKVRVNVTIRISDICKDVIFTYDRVKIYTMTDEELDNMINTDIQAYINNNFGFGYEILD